MPAVLRLQQPDGPLTRQIVAVAERHAKGRIVSLLEGGYVLPVLAGAAAAHVKVLIGAD